MEIAFIPGKYHSNQFTANFPEVSAPGRIGGDVYQVAVCLWIRSNLDETNQSPMVLWYACQPLQVFEPSGGKHFTFHPVLSSQPDNDYWGR